MDAELWQFAGVIALWIVFVYLPRRTAEDDPQNPPEDRQPGNEDRPRM